MLSFRLIKGGRSICSLRTERWEVSKMWLLCRRSDVASNKQRIGCSWPIGIADRIGRQNGHGEGDRTVGRTDRIDGKTDADGQTSLA